MKERIEKQATEEEERLKRRSSKSEPEQVKHAKIRHSDSDEKFKSSRKDGEEKYETMIYSISTSSGKFSSMHISAWKALNLYG